MLAKEMFQSPSMYLTELAKSGDTDALDILLRYFMQCIETTARSSIKHGFVRLILEGYTSTPDQKQSEKYLRCFFDYLQIPAIQKVKIFARNHDTHCLAWWSILEVCALQSTLDSSVCSSSEAFCIFEAEYSDHRAIPLTNVLIANPFQIPQPIAFVDLPGNLQANIRRAGLRLGETRSYDEAKQIYEMLPENIRRGGVDAVKAYKQKHDWSHQQAYAKGGSSCPSNGDWESSSINRSRGSRHMTKAEVDNIAQAKAQINFQEGVKIVGSQAAKAGIIAFGIEVTFSGLENFLAVQRGEKTVEQALGDTLINSAGAAVVAVVVVGSVTALTLIFPPVGVALSATTPFLQIVGVASSISRLVRILSNSGKVHGIDSVEALMLSYGIDDVELSFRDLEIEAELIEMKLAM
jgi:hypothetical protein